MGKNEIRSTKNQLLLENDELRQRVYELDETLNSIRNGEIDAILVSGIDGEKLYSLSSVETKYRVIIDEMYEGAVTLSREGIITYCNLGFSELISEPMERIIGSYFVDFLSESEKLIFLELFETGLRNRCIGELTYILKDGHSLNLSLSINPLPEKVLNGICILFSDITKLRQQEKELINLNTALEQKVAKRTAELTRSIGELTARNTQFRQLIYSITERFQHIELIYDKNGKVSDYYYLNINPAFERLTGKTREQLVGNSAKKIFGIIEDQLIQAYDEVAKSGISATIENKGAELEKYYSFYIWKISDSQVAVISSDISERKNAENELKAIARRLELSLISSNAGTWDWDVKSGNIGWSQKNFELFGLDPMKSSASFDSWRAILHPDDLELAEARIGLALKDHKILNSDYRVIMPDGKIRWINSTGEGIYDEEGNPVQMIGMCMDITQRKQAEEEIKFSAMRFEALLSQTPSNVVIYRLIRDDAGNIMDWEISDINELGAVSIGLEREAAIGKRTLALFGAGVMAPYFEIARQVMASGKPQVFETYFESNKQFYLTSVFLVDNDHYANVSVDITGRKEADKEIRILNDELEQRVIKRTAQLESANKELEAFSYSVSHDLRTPLRAVHGFTNILLEEYENILDEEGKRLCGIIISSAIKMGNLIDDLLRFSRIGRRDLNSSIIDMASMAESVFAEIATENERAKVNLEIGLLHQAIGDVNLIRLVWSNLISNAIKYSSKKNISEITIGSNRYGNKITYFIKDNGAGFDMQYGNKLFGVFQRLHSDTEFEGNGVGLAIVLRIILKHKGTVWAESEIGMGSTFYFSLPASPESVQSVSGKINGEERNKEALKEIKRN